MTEALTYCALIPLPADGGEVALPDELIERAKDYMAEALSERTREAYGRWQRAFTGWCERHGRQALPASPETIAAWLTALADGVDGRRPLARASINQALAAVTLAHRLAGYAFDRKHRVISMTWSGISRVKAMTKVDVPALRIQQHTRHKSADMVARYVRESDKWSKSGLKGVLRRTGEAASR